MLIYLTGAVNLHMKHGVVSLVLLKHGYWTFLVDGEPVGEHQQQNYAEPCQMLLHWTEAWVKPSISVCKCMQ